MSDPDVTHPSGPAGPVPAWTPTPPRLVLALALVGAVVLSLVAALLVMVASGPVDVGLSAELGLLRRIQLGARLIDGATLLAVPLAVLFARLVEPASGAPAHPAVRCVLIGASAVGSTATFLVILRLLADAGDRDLRPAGVAATLLVDLGHLLVALSGVWWAMRELRRLPPGPGSYSSTPAPLPTLGGLPSPGSVATVGGFPTGPPPPRPPGDVPPGR